MDARTVWWLLTWACVVWYSSVTAYVAWKGFKDIRRMLERLERGRDESPGD